MSLSIAQTKMLCAIRTSFNKTALGRDPQDKKDPVSASESSSEFSFEPSEARDHQEATAGVVSPSASASLLFVPSVESTDEPSCGNVVLPLYDGDKSDPVKESSNERLLKNQVECLRKELEAEGRRNYDLQVEKSAQQEVIDDLSDMLRYSSSTKIMDTGNEDDVETRNSELVNRLQAKTKAIELEKELLEKEILVLQDKVKNLETQAEAREEKIKAFEHFFIIMNGKAMDHRLSQTPKTWAQYVFQWRTNGPSLGTKK